MNKFSSFEANREFVLPDINLEQTKFESKIPSSNTMACMNEGMQNMMTANIDEFNESNIGDDCSEMDDLNMSMDSIQTEGDTFAESMISKPRRMHDFTGGGKLEQPSFHRESRTFCQKLFPVLARSTDLSPSELHAYHTIKS